MSEITALFSKPFHVMQFWASDRYSVHQKESEGLVATLAVDEPEAGKWFFSLSNGPNTPFVGDYLPPFLPTRENIAILNAACRKASVLLEKYKADENFPMPKRSICEGITPFEGVVSRNLEDSKYKAHFSAVLWADWGIELPDLHNWDWHDIVFSYRPGLPCAAAMVRGVQPILEAVVGPLERVSQAAIREGESMFDVIEYRHSSGVTFPQRFDITEYFGKDLPWTDFSFEPPIGEPSPVSAPGPAVAQPASVPRMDARTTQSGKYPMLKYLQGSVLGLGLLLAAFACVYVPYSAERLREGDNVFEPVGHHFIWAPPDREDTCVEVFDYSWASRCRVRMDMSKLVLTVSFISLVTAGLTVLLGLLGRITQGRPR